MFFASAVFGAVSLTGLPGNPIAAAPAKAALHFTPPLAAARTIQVTETIFGAGNGSAPGPLRQAGTMTFRIERPDKFRVEWVTQDRSAHQRSLFISNGQKMVSSEDGHTRSQLTAHAEWPFPLMGLLNNMPGPMSAVSAVREEKKILLATQRDPGGGSEFWFDPKTHLLLRWSMFITWQGKTSEVMRTEYSGWLLNKPLSASTFRLPVPDGKPK